MTAPVIVPTHLLVRPFSVTDQGAGFDEKVTDVGSFFKRWAQVENAGQFQKTPFDTLNFSHAVTCVCEVLVG